MFGIWIGIHEQYDKFKQDLPFGLHTWEATKLRLSFDFLDLTISIENDQMISTKSFQKSMNLYLYIPATQHTLQAW